MSSFYKSRYFIVPILAILFLSLLIEYYLEQVFKEHKLLFAIGTIFLYVWVDQKARIYYFSNFMNNHSTQESNHG